MKKMIFFALIIVLLAACNQQKAESPAISLNDVETAIQVHGMALEEADLSSDHAFGKTLHDVSPTVYRLDDRTLSIYIFPTEDDRVKGMEDFEYKTATASVDEHRTYPVENLLAFYAGGSQEMNDKLNAIFASLAPEETFFSLNDKDGLELLASEKTLPNDMHEHSFQREFPPHHEYFIYKAKSQKEFEEIADLFSSQQTLRPLPAVDFEENDVLFIGVRESGSCPYELKWAENNSERSFMAFKLTISSSTDDCTTDASPRSYVVQVAHELLHQHEHVIVIQGNTKTVVPIYDMHFENES